MKFKFISIGLCLVLFTSCKNTVHLNKIEGKQILVSDSIATDQQIDAFIAPYREHVNTELGTVISYAKESYSKTDGELNTAIGNLMADAVFEEANPIFKARTGKDIDVVLLNHGGIRADIYKGDVTLQTAFKIMPFENKIVVTELRGDAIKELLQYLADAKRAHPISGLKLQLNAANAVNSAEIQNEPIDLDRGYYVATNDYLYNGGSGMDFFKKRDTVYDLDYKIRNILIDYFKKKDTLDPKIDDRFTKLKQ